MVEAVVAEDDDVGFWVVAFDNVVGFVFGAAVEVVIKVVKILLLVEFIEFTGKH